MTTRGKFKGKPSVRVVQQDGNAHPRLTGVENGKGTWTFFSRFPSPKYVAIRQSVATCRGEPYHATRRMMKCTTHQDEPYSTIISEVGA